MLRWMRWIWLAIGWMATLLALIGTLLPVMPTVPFLIVAVWAFARSSPHLRDKILNDPRFGPPLRDWLDYGAIPLKIKLFSVVAMACGCVFAFLIGVPPTIVAVQATVCAAAAVYIVTRPLPPRH